MECCTEYYDLGCIGKCDEVNTTVTAAQTGTYQVQYRTPNSIKRENIELEIGDDIAFDNFFNEDAINVFTVTDPALNYVTKDGKPCFRITIR